MRYSNPNPENPEKHPELDPCFTFTIVYTCFNRLLSGLLAFRLPSEPFRLNLGSSDQNIRLHPSTVRFL